MSRKEQESRPQKPTKNGHYSGVSTGFYYEDGRYRIAPTHSGTMEGILEEESALRFFVEGQNSYVMKQYRKIAEQRKRFWESLGEDLGLDFKVQNFRYADGWLTPVSVDEASFDCIYCGLSGFKGKEVLIEHHGACPKNPWAKG